MTVKRFLSILPAVALATTLAACGSSSSGGSAGGTPSTAATTSTSASPAAASGSLTVASAAFTESNILAQMYADLLKKAGFTVDLKQVESSEVFQSSLDKGTIAVVPEYAATYADSLQTLVTGTQNPTAASPSLSVTLKHLKKWENKLGLTNLTPAQAVDQNAFAVTKAFATAASPDDAVAARRLRDPGQAGGARRSARQPAVLRARPEEHLPHQHHRTHPARLRLACRSSRRSRAGRTSSARSRPPTPRSASSVSSRSPTTSTCRTPTT